MNSSEVDDDSVDECESPEPTVATNGSNSGKKQRKVEFSGVNECEKQENGDRGNQKRKAEDFG